MLTAERMNALMVAVTVGKPVNTKNREEAAFVEAIQDDVDEALTIGKELRLPPESIVTPSPGARRTRT